MEILYKESSLKNHFAEQSSGKMQHVLHMISNE